MHKKKHFCREKNFILSLKKTYEDHHNIKCLDSTLEVIIEVSSRYINDRVFPDKAIDLLDESMSLAQQEDFEELTICNSNLYYLDDNQNTPGNVFISDDDNSDCDVDINDDIDDNILEELRSDDYKNTTDIFSAQLSLSAEILFDFSYITGLNERHSSFKLTFTFNPKSLPA